MMDNYTGFWYTYVSGFTKSLRIQQKRGKRSADPKPYAAKERMIYV